MPRPALLSTRGFSLVEMAVVVAIVGLLLAGLLLPLGTQLEQRQITETTRRLEEAREALIGFAIVNKRLPCPATAAAASGDEDPAVVTGICTTNYSGFLPAKALGFQPTDAAGYALDAWGNRIRYAVSATTWGTTPFARFTKQHNALDATAAWTLNTTPTDLVICNASPATVTNTTCDAGTSVTNQNTLVAVIYSTGKNSATGGTGTNEARNLDGNALFVSRVPDPSGAAGGEFDDILVWIPVGMLYGRLTTAGVLP